MYGRNLDNDSRQWWQEKVYDGRIVSEFNWSNHDFFSRKSVDVHSCPGLLTYAGGTPLK